MTSDHNDELPERAERWLTQWTLDEAVAPDFEKLARRVEESLGETAIGSTSSDLLEPPLPGKPEEGEQTPVERAVALEKGIEKPERARPPSSSRLAEMARASVSRRRDADSLDIVRQSMSLARTPLKVANETGPRSVPLASAETGGASTEAGAEAERRSAPARHQVRDGRGPGAVAWLGLGVGVLGVAAAIAMYVSLQSRSRGAAAEVPPSEKQFETVRTPPETPAAEAEQKRASAAKEPIEQHDENTTKEGAVAATDLADLPAEPIKSVVSVPARGRASEPGASRKTPEKVLLAEDPSRATESSEEAEARNPSRAVPLAVVPAPLQPADATGSERPEAPSQGAVLAALGTVMGSARACVAGQDAPSRAVVVFGSSGQVQSVSVSGPAAGTPSEQCIVSALSGARVAPFSRPTFTASASIRP